MFGSMGMSELVIILVIALIIFGPRKLPELGRSLGKRITWAAVSIGVGFMVAFAFIQQIFNFVMIPLTAAVKGGKLVYTEPMEAFSLYIWMAALAGLLIAAPVVMTQVWLFVAPGLYQH